MAHFEKAYFVACPWTIVRRGATMPVAMVLSPLAAGIMFMKTTIVMLPSAMLPAKVL